MAKKSDNIKGNPYHNEEDGKFTSPDDGGTKNSEESSEFKLQTVSNQTTVKPSLKVKTVNLDAIKSKVKDINQVANIPRLSSAKDIENNIEEYFSQQVCKKIDELYGKETDCAHYQFHPKSNDKVDLNIFTCVLGKYRYKDNHAHVLNEQDFYKLMDKQTFFSTKNAFDSSKNWNSSSSSKSRLLPLQPVFRGFTSTGQKRKDIIDSYGAMDYNNLDIYGNGMYGTNVYTTVDYNYARGYGTPIECILDTRNAYSMTERQLSSVIRSINTYSIPQKISSRMVANGIDQDRANRIANSFVKSLTSDISLVAILLGVDFQVSSNHQRNVLNLNRWYIKEENQYGY